MRVKDEVFFLQTFFFSPFYFVFSLCVYVCVYMCICVFVSKTERSRRKVCYLYLQSTAEDDCDMIGLNYAS